MYQYVEIKCQLDATEVFIADLIACSTCFGHHYAHHQELKSIIHLVAACSILCCGFSSSWSGVELRVMRPVCRMLHGQNHIKFAKGLKKRVFILRKILTVLLSPPLLS